MILWLIILMATFILLLLLILDSMVVVLQAITSLASSGVLVLYTLSIISHTLMLSQLYLKNY